MNALWSSVGDASPITSWLFFVLPCWPPVFLKAVSVVRGFERTRQYIGCLFPSWCPPNLLDRNACHALPTWLSWIGTKGVGVAHISGGHWIWESQCRLLCVLITCRVQMNSVQRESWSAGGIPKRH